MVVIYAEKSSLAKEIAHVLHAGKRNALKDEPTIGYYEFQFHGEDAILCHGVGHLMQLIAAKGYGAAYSKWNTRDFPCIPEKFQVAAKSSTIACSKLVKSFLEKADWCINATDADREGELIFSYVYEVCGCKAPYKRAWIQDLTDEKIQYAFDNLIEPTQSISEQMKGTPDDLQAAGRARDIADWLVGNNLTVAATCQYGGNTMLTVGRVQTPTLALVVEREKAILAHVKTPFWKLMAQFTTPNGATFEAESEHGNYTVQQEGEDALAACGTQDGIVTTLETKRKSIPLPLLYNSTQLQAEANKKMGWDATKTASVMQSLYEKKFMTYPRTSSEYLTEGMIPEITLTVQKILKLPEYEQYALPAEEWQPFGKRHFDNSKVGSHPAITPSVNVPESLSSLTEDEKALYDLLAKSLIRMIYPKAQTDDTTAKIAVQDTIFKASGSVVAVKGWYTVDAMPEKKKVLPVLHEQDVLAGKYSLKQGETEPPKRYTEADLLSAMELAGQQLDDEDARTLMKLQKKGLGTDATRASIIQGLFDKQYMTKKGKSILPTELGMFLIDTLPLPALKSAELTGEWEKKLNDISLGDVSLEEFVSGMKAFTKECFAAVAASEPHPFVSEGEKSMVCPHCGKTVRKTKFGYGCIGYTDGCQFSVSQEICGKQISEDIVLQLCEKKRSVYIKGFTSQKGNSFDAYLVVNQDTGKVEFDFTSEAEKALTCPHCKKPVVKTKFGYVCSGKDAGCQFSVGLTVCGKKLSENTIVTICKSGRTAVIKGFTSQKGNSFDAALVVNQSTGKVEFNFPAKKE